MVDFLFNLVKMVFAGVLFCLSLVVIYSVIKALYESSKILLLVYVGITICISHFVPIYHFPFGGRLLLVGTVLGGVLLLIGLMMIPFSNSDNNNSEKSYGNPRYEPLPKKTESSDGSGYWEKPDPPLSHREQHMKDNGYYSGGYSIPDKGHARLRKSGYYEHGCTGCKHRKYFDGYNSSCQLHEIEVYSDTTCDNYERSGFC